MKITERLLECKVKLGIKSDYELADVLGVNRSKLHECKSGKGKPDAYLTVRVADVLKIHPMLLLAEFEADKAKDETRKGFWLNFARRIKAGALGIMALISTAFWLPEQKASGAILDTHNVYYVKCT